MHHSSSTIITTNVTNITSTINTNSIIIRNIAIIITPSIHQFIIHPAIPFIQLPEVGLEEVLAQRELPDPAT